MTPTLVLNESSNFVGIYAGSEYSIAFTLENKLFSFGQGINYKLGFGDQTTRIYPTLLSNSFNLLSITKGLSDGHTYLLTDTNDVYTFGSTNTVSFTL